MCLSTVSKLFNPPNKRIRKAWKVAEPHGEKTFRTPFYLFVLTDEWRVREITGTSDSIAVSSPVYTGIQLYPQGFHVFKTKKEAKVALDYFKKDCPTAYRDAVILPVEVKGVTCEGFDASDTSEDFVALKLRVFVANWIRLVPAR